MWYNVRSNAYRFFFFFFDTELYNLQCSKSTENKDKWFDYWLSSFFLTKTDKENNFF